MTVFTEFGLAEPILRALSTKGYADPTPIQQQAIPALLEGRDLLGIAQTGTGKTAAFSLPSLHRLAANPTPRKPAGCRMLVLSPTRELAAQIAENMRNYARFLDLSVQCVFGGMPVGQQARRLDRGCDVLVATPGRLLDLIDQRALTLRHVEIFVLDEADQMMDLGFIKPLTRIAALLPEGRQSLFFSATMPESIAQLGKRFIRNPVRVEVAPQATTAERVDQFVTFVDQREKQALLSISLRKGLASGEIESALVFTRTKHGADRVVRHLVSAGVHAAAIHGNKTQAQRTRALDGFRQGSVPVLVATDIAARGIDVPGVSAVFNFELPNVPEQYVHRIGRTARAGRSGLAVSLVAKDEQVYLRDIERLTGVALTRAPLPQDFTAMAAKLPAPAHKRAGAERAEEDRTTRFRKGRGAGERRDRRDEYGDRREERGERGERGASSGKPVSHKRGPVTKPVAAARPLGAKGSEQGNNPNRRDSGSNGASSSGRDTGRESGRDTGRTNARGNGRRRQGSGQEQGPGQGQSRAGRQGGGQPVGRRRG